MNFVDLATAITDILKSVPGFGMLVTFQAIDIISGLSVAAGKGKWNSSVGRKGLSRKVGMLCLFGCSVAIERWVPGSPPLSGVAALFLSWGEILSILENADDLGIPLPPAVVNWMRERQQMSQKQFDRAITKNGGLHVDFVEMTSHRVDQQAEHVHQTAGSAEVKAESVILKKRDTDPETNVIQ